MVGLTPLHSAARYNHVEVCALLLALDGVDVNLQDEDGWTPLHYAARNAHLQIVELLLARPDVDVNRKDKRGNTPLYFAMNQKIRALMQEHGGI